MYQAIIPNDCSVTLQCCLDNLRINFIDMCMTSPPYWGLRDYHTGTWEGGDPKCPHRRTSKFSIHTQTGQKNPLAASGDGLYKDVCGLCGAKRVDKQLGLERTPEIYISKLCNIFDKVQQVLKPEGTCWVNIGDTYGKDKSLIGAPLMFALEMIRRGWILRNTIIWHKPNCIPSSVKDRFTVDFEYLFLFVKNKKYYFNQQTEPIKEVSLKRIKSKYNAAKSKEFGFTNKSQSKWAQKVLASGETTRNKRCVWKISSKGVKGAHCATYPIDLCLTPIKAGCPEGGVVLDPFAGSGTTLVAAKQLGRDYIGIELNPEYIEIARRRLEL